MEWILRDGIEGNAFRRTIGYFQRSLPRQIGLRVGSRVIIGVHPTPIIPSTDAITRGAKPQLWNKCPGQRQSLEPKRGETRRDAAKEPAREHSRRSDVWATTTAVAVPWGKR